MDLLNNLKQKLTTALKIQSLNSPIYLEDGAQFVCQDHKNKKNMSTRIIARHVGDDPDDFPKFQIYKTAALDGMFGMHRELTLNLDTDESPIQGSHNLVTSGNLYKVINNLQEQIDELKNIINTTIKQ